MRLTIATALLLLAMFGCKSSRDQPEDPLVTAAKACTARDGDLGCVRPIFNVHNLKESQAYYRDALGFKLDWDHGDPPDFASVSRGETVLFMCQGCQGNPGSWVMVFTCDVDALHTELVKRHAIIRMPPTDMPWGMREMHVADPNGNVIRFGSSLDEAARCKR